MNMVSDFNTRLNDMMRTLQITQQQISDRTGISKASISKYVKNGMKPKVSSLTLIAKTFGVNPVWLMGYDVDMFKVSKEDSIESAYPFYLAKLNDMTARLTEPEREIAYNVLCSIFPGAANK